MFSLSACSLLKHENVQDKKVTELLSSLIGVGEGRGRLGINQQQYLFSFDALLKNKTDWILAANIPLHGEEILVLSNLEKEKGNELREELEVRIERGISEYLRSKKQSPELAGKFLLELRRIMRLVLAPKLDLAVECTENQCRMDEVIYQVEATDKQLSLKKSISDEYEIEYTALNLTDSIFKRSNVFFHSKNKSKNTPALLSLELFWN